jgi:hypothetical protein
MTELKIKTHSVVDVITNSSTVIYTQAGEGTISAIKEMVNALLALGESDLTADDLFNFELSDEEVNDWTGYGDVTLTVTTKIEDENAKIAGKILNELDSLFDHEASYDG